MTFAMVDPPTGAKNTPRLEAEYVRFGHGGQALSIAPSRSLSRCVAQKVQAPTFAGGVFRAEHVRSARLTAEISDLAFDLGLTE
jgi:hypothetical protein